MQFYSTFDIERSLEIKRTRLQEWIKNGFVIPSQASGGRGMKALFSIEDLYGIRLFIELLNMNFDRLSASHIMQYVLGQPIPMQEKPVNWDTDYLNLTRRSLIEKDNKYPLSYFPTYGEPIVSQYFQKKDTPGKVPFCHIIIRLRDIKAKIDREIP